MPKKIEERELEQLDLFSEEQKELKPLDVVAESDANNLAEYELSVDPTTEAIEEDLDDGVEGSIGESYAEVEKEIIYVDPATGETVDPNNLDAWGKIKFVANQLGQTLDEPKKGCKHCYGRGYTSIDAHTQLPTPCACVYTTYRKNNPHSDSIRPKMNRASGRKYQKAISKYYRSFAEKAVVAQIIEANSKENLGKNTPGFIPLSQRVSEVPQVEAEVVEVEPTSIETAEGTLNG